MLRCRQFVEIATDYQEGRLPWAERVRCSMHLALCPQCREYARQMKLTARLLRSLPAETATSEARADAMARFRALQQRTHAEAKTPPQRHGLDTLEKLLGGPRGWAVIGAMCLALVAFALLADKDSGGFGNGTMCLLTGVASGVAPLLVLAAMAIHKRAVLSPGLYGAIAAFGAFAGYLSLEANCPMADVAAHTLAFHMGAIVVSSAIGATVSRLPLIR